MPVLLPSVHTDVRLTRAEFEAMIRPALGDTLVVLRRTLRSAGVEADELHSVLLVGGSSRIPLIAQMVAADVGRPIALDVHPKHSVALGAAVLAGAAAGIAASAAGDTSTVRGPFPAPTVAEPLPEPGPAPTPPTAGRPRRRRSLAVGAVGVGAVAIAGVVLVLGPGGGDARGSAGSTTEGGLGATTATDTLGSSAPPTTVAVVATAPPSITAPAAPPTSASVAPATTAAPPDPCADAGGEPCIVIDSLRITDAGAVEVRWSPRNFSPDVASGFHAHLYWNSGTAAQASTDAADPVGWDAVEATVHTSAEVLVLTSRPAGATGVCATVGIAPAHTAYDPTRFHCLDLPTGSF